MGNVNPLETGVRRTPAEGHQATLSVLNKSESERIILSGGGGVSPDLPRENIQAILSALNEYNATRDGG